MNSIIGRFHLKEVDGKQYLVYYLDNPGKQSMDSGNTDNNYLSVSTLFLCPERRMDSVRDRIVDIYGEKEWKNMNVIEIDSSPYLNSVIQDNKSSDDNNERERLDLDNHDHYVLPLFWYKNKDGDVDGNCKMCSRDLKMGSGYYFCVKCDQNFHKECVESPPEIRHPHHPTHPLKLSFLRDTVSVVYRCHQCDINMGNIYAFKAIPFVIEKTKRHDHPLTFFTRKDHLRCNVCGLINKTDHATYVCLKCDFVVHQDCVDFPSIIRISRHHHRISFTSSLPPGKWSCGVCRKNIDGDYGAYTCNKCDGYVVHSKCALRKDIWDGEELEGIPEENDIEEVLDPFERISDGLILHFLHKHALRLETSGEVYDESKICEACVLPIFKGDFYSCVECEFLLHHDCANASRQIRHPLHPHSLTLKVTNDKYNKTIGVFTCYACSRECSGFAYESNSKERHFKLDVRCGSIYEPFIYEGHEHPLFLALDPQEKHICQVCQKDDRTLINCIECDFIICLKCVNLPYMVRYKHDNHFLTLTREKEINEPNWCEICERVLISSGEDGEDQRFYECKQCCTTLHINCLLGKLPYIKPGHTIYGKIQVIANNSLSRPFCHRCRNRCADKTFLKLDNFTLCSLKYCT